MDRRIYWIWLQRCLPLGSLAMNRLLEHFGDAASIYAASEQQLTPFLTRAQDKLLFRNRSLTDAQHILQAMQDMNGWVLTPEDALYPELLRQIDGFPAVLYGEGYFPDLRQIPAFALVGTRHPTPDGMANAYCLAGGLAAAGMPIVSGGAVGIDAAAHAGALAAGGRTILIKAAPPEVEYPVANTELRRQILENGGAIVTEYPPGFPYYCDYHVRNRLIAGMTVGSCVVEAPARSGSLITANMAREQGRDVFAMPGSAAAHRNDGAHTQIRRGALLVTRASEVLEEYVQRYPGILDLEAAAATEADLRAAPSVISKSQPQKKNMVEKPPVAAADAALTKSAVSASADGASAEAKQVFALLTATPCPVDELAGKIGLSVAALLALLTELEILGYAGCAAGQQYYRV